MSFIKTIIKEIGVFLFPVFIWKKFVTSQHNNEESSYLIWLCQEINAHKSFIEFGYGPFQFNSVSLAKNGYKGLLLDGSEKSCRYANYIFKSSKLKCNAITHWIALDTLDPIKSFVMNLNNKLGVLNVDIDGNDYWILKELLKTISPEIICVEHNASLGLKSISTPYKKYFDRHEEHKSGFYHGASITAFYKLLNPSYCLVKNVAGVNLIFVRNDKMNKNLLSLTPETCFSEPYNRNKFSGMNTKLQWEVIKKLSYENI